jgi:glutathione S-transferase
MLFVPATLEPPGFEVLLHAQILPEAKRIAAIVPFATAGYQQVLRVLSKELDHDGYLLGEQFTCADIMLGTTLTWLPGLLEDHPPLLAYTARVTARRRAIEWRCRIHFPIKLSGIQPLLKNSSGHFYSLY